MPHLAKIIILYKKNIYIYIFYHHPVIPESLRRIRALNLHFRKYYSTGIRVLDRTSRLRPTDAATLRGRISISYCSSRYRKYCRLYVAEGVSGRDLGFQINSYDRPARAVRARQPRFETFYAKIQRLTRAVGRCCPLESGIDSAPSSMSDLSFGGAYKATVPRAESARAGNV